MRRQLTYKVPGGLHNVEFCFTGKSRRESKLRGLSVDWFVNAPKFVVRMQDDMTRWETKGASAQLSSEFSWGGPDYQFNCFWTTRIASFWDTCLSIVLLTVLLRAVVCLRVVRTHMKCVNLVGRLLLLRTSKLRSRSRIFFG